MSGYSPFNRKGKQLIKAYQRHKLIHQQTSHCPSELEKSVISLRIAVETFTYSIANTITPHWYLSVLPFWSKKLVATRNLIKGIHIEKQVERPNIGLWTVGSRVYSIDISYNGEKIVSRSYDKKVRIWNAKTGDAIGKPLQGHTGSVMSVAFSADGEKIVSGSDDKTVRIWDIKKWECH